ncbi:MAG: SDR family oxidoreductase [Micrococcales bacterium]|nr:SDR family oxidoreductase [Micrococcales bacterium]
MSTSPRQQQVVIVTGAGSGLGRAMAVSLAAGGHRLVLAGRRAQALDETVDLVRSAGAEALAVPTDVTDTAQVERLVQACVTSYGRLDVLVNNAGAFGGGGTIDAVSDEDWEAALAVNLTGYFRCARAAWRQLVAQDPPGGRIINNGSVAAQVPRVGGVTYATTKHAITGLTKALEIDGRRVGVRCTQVDIGNAATPMTTRMQEGMPQPDGSVRPEPTFDSAHVGDFIRYVVELPLEVTFPFATIAAAGMPWLARG